MRSQGLAALALATCLAAPAAAQMRTQVSVATYAIEGTSAEELLASMDRRGPRQGWLTRAIAQTSYSVGWKLEWKHAGDVCRLARADATLTLSYKFPQPSARLPPQVARRWSRFMAGVSRHEHHHGEVARQMVVAAGRAVRRLSVRDDPRCAKAQQEVSRIVNAVYAAYEARQVRFDEVEHRDGGPVDHLIERFVDG